MRGIQINNYFNNTISLNGKKISNSKPANVQNTARLPQPLIIDHLHDKDSLERSENIVDQMGRQVNFGSQHNNNNAKGFMCIKDARSPQSTTGAYNSSQKKKRATTTVYHNNPNKQNSTSIKKQAAVTLTSRKHQYEATNSNRCHSRRMHEETFNNSSDCLRKGSSAERLIRSKSRQSKSKSSKKRLGGWAIDEHSEQSSQKMLIRPHKANFNTGRSTNEGTVKRSKSAIIRHSGNPVMGNYRAVDKSGQLLVTPNPTCISNKNGPQSVKKSASGKKITGSRKQLGHHTNQQNSGRKKPAGSTGKNAMLFSNPSGTVSSTNKFKSKANLYSATGAKNKNSFQFAKTRQDQIATEFLKLNPNSQKPNSSHFQTQKKSARTTVATGIKSCLTSAKQSKPLSARDKKAKKQLFPESSQHDFMLPNSEGLLSKMRQLSQQSKSNDEQQVHQAIEQLQDALGSLSGRVLAKHLKKFTQNLKRLGDEEELQEGYEDGENRGDRQQERGYIYIEDKKKKKKNFKNKDENETAFGHTKKFQRNLAVYKGQAQGSRSNKSPKSKSRQLAKTAKRTKSNSVANNGSNSKYPLSSMKSQKSNKKSNSKQQKKIASNRSHDQASTTQKKQRMQAAAQAFLHQPQPQVPYSQTPAPSQSQQYQLTPFDYEESSQEQNRYENYQLQTPNEFHRQNQNFTDQIDDTSEISVNCKNNSEYAKFLKILQKKSPAKSSSFSSSISKNGINNKQDNFNEQAEQGLVVEVTSQFKPEQQDDFNIEQINQYLNEKEIDNNRNKKANINISMNTNLNKKKNKNTNMNINNDSKPNIREYDSQQVTSTSRPTAKNQQNGSAANPILERRRHNPNANPNLRLNPCTKDIDHQLGDRGYFAAIYDEDYDEQHTQRHGRTVSDKIAIRHQNAQIDQRSNAIQRMNQIQDLKDFRKISDQLIARNPKKEENVAQNKNESESSASKKQKLLYPFSPGVASDIISNKIDFFHKKKSTEKLTVDVDTSYEDPTSSSLKNKAASPSSTHKAPQYDEHYPLIPVKSPKFPSSEFEIMSIFSAKEKFLASKHQKMSQLVEKMYEKQLVSPKSYEFSMYQLRKQYEEQNQCIDGFRQQASEILNEIKRDKEDIQGIDDLIREQKWEQARKFMGRSSQIYAGGVGIGVGSLSSSLPSNSSLKGFKKSKKAVTLQVSKNSQQLNKDQPQLDIRKTQIHIKKQPQQQHKQDDDSAQWQLLQISTKQNKQIEHKNIDIRIRPTPVTKQGSSNSDSQQQIQAIRPITLDANSQKEQNEDQQKELKINHNKDKPPHSHKPASVSKTGIMCLDALDSKGQESSDPSESDLSESRVSEQPRHRLQDIATKLDFEFQEKYRLRSVEDLNSNYHINGGVQAQRGQPSKPHGIQDLNAEAEKYLEKVNVDNIDSETDCIYYQQDESEEATVDIKAADDDNNSEIDTNKQEEEIQQKKYQEKMKEKKNEKEAETEKQKQKIKNYNQNQIDRTDQEQSQNDKSQLSNLVKLIPSQPVDQKEKASYPTKSPSKTNDRNIAQIKMIQEEIESNPSYKADEEQNCNLENPNSAEQTVIDKIPEIDQSPVEFYEEGQDHFRAVHQKNNDSQQEPEQFDSDSVIELSIRKGFESNLFFIKEYCIAMCQYIRDNELTQKRFKQDISKPQSFDLEHLLKSYRVTDPSTGQYDNNFSSLTNDLPYYKLFRKTPSNHTAISDQVADVFNKQYSALKFYNIDVTEEGKERFAQDKQLEKIFLKSILAILNESLDVQRPGSIYGKCLPWAHNSKHLKNLKYVISSEKAVPEEQDENTPQNYDFIFGVAIARIIQWGSCLCGFLPDTAELQNTEIQEDYVTHIRQTRMAFLLQKALADQESHINNAELEETQVELCVSKQISELVFDEVASEIMQINQNRESLQRQQNSE